MKIEHLAIWCHDIELMRDFYQRHFNAQPNTKYCNNKKQFQSYFLTFDGETRLELMQMTGIVAKTIQPPAQQIGLAHFAISVGSQEKVDKLTEQLVHDGYKKLDGPRTTGDGYYESVILDPENNRIEITV